MAAFSLMLSESDPALPGGGVTPTSHVNCYFVEISLYFKYLSGKFSVIMWCCFTKS